MTPQKLGRPRIRFPQDEGIHPAFPIEWWYGHFSLTSSDGMEYGAMVAYFSFGLRIISISDLATRRFLHFVAGSAPHYIEGHLDLRWGRDHWFSTKADSFSYSLESYSAGLSLNLTLDSKKSPLPGCGNGLIKWTGGNSYYYSLTRLKAKGQIELPGSKLDVEGIGWMDHQWMRSLGQGGWDWFAAQLDNDTEIVFWRIVNPDESVKSSDLTILFPDNSAYHTRELTLERLDSWTSPDSGREYGICWRVREKNHGLDLVIDARYARQEVSMFETLSVPAFHFWEGVTKAYGRLDDEVVSGIGYAELVRPPRDAG